mmetsp:Transcript_11034/g.18172  ORF Transcript_11034/g.18172 Transcript_11034/m.18172 type:complete len:818 (-) Transcript_11034:524-2977(-)
MAWTMDDKKEGKKSSSADNYSANAAAGSGSCSGSSLEEDAAGEQKLELEEWSVGGSGGGKLKTPEDERDVKATSSDVSEEKKQDESNIKGTSAYVHEHKNLDVQQNNNEANSIVTPQCNNANAAQEDDDSAVHSGDSRPAVSPGMMFIAGPGYTGMGIFSGYSSDQDDDIEEGGVILEGFLPEDDPSRRRRRRQITNNSHAESTRERVQRLIDNAITLDDTAVRPIPIEEDGDDEGTGGDDDEEDKSEMSWLLTLGMLVMVACIMLAIILSLTLRGEPENVASQDTMTVNCLPGDVDARFASAKSIFASITSPDILDDESTPQGKAIWWTVCSDSISVQLLDNQDSSTGILPKQKHGFRLSGDSGEAHVTRRYILATFFYSTTQDSPWLDSLNFLSPDHHECSWHKNYTRKNFPFGDFDPVGVHCTIDTGVTSTSFTDGFLLDDEEYPLRELDLNFRVDINLNGQLPLEIGYLVDCKSIGLETHTRLTGPLPETMGNMASLYSLSLILNGPDFGGELPRGLFQLRNLRNINLILNMGDKWSLPDSVQVDEDAQLEQLDLSRNGFTGNIPSWIAQLSRLQTLELSHNKFQGAIPEEIGNLSSIKHLNLMGNNLTGTIPSSLGQLPAIEILIFANNDLQGELPDSIGNLRTLLLLDVGSNELTSVIPSSFANLESLRYLLLDSNKFNGTVDVLESMKNLTVLLIRSNSFSGALPDGIFSESSGNIVVDVGVNKFTGELPSSFANMSNLDSLFAAKNSFAHNATRPAVCDNTTFLVMDCDACECCEVCCDGGNGGLCDFKLDVRTMLRYDCGSWLKSCLP